MYWISTSQEPNEVGVTDEHLFPSVPWEVPALPCGQAEFPREELPAPALTHPYFLLPWDQ